jgi:NAD+ kinase
VATLRATILIDPERPKAKRAEVLKMLKEAGIAFSDRAPDLGVVVGGDGIFSHYGRLASFPLLFVSVRSSDPTASKGYLAAVNLDGLPKALKQVAKGDYEVVEYPRLQVSINGRIRGEVLTDVYLEKGADSNCLRYELEVSGPESRFTDAAIANGVIICTSAGSTGYYSYIDKLKDGRVLHPRSHTRIEKEQVGVCHIAPILTERSGSKEAPLRYTVPLGTSFRLTLTRDADARLFGMTKSRKGIRIRVGDLVEVKRASETTRIVRLPKSG